MPDKRDMHKAKSHRNSKSHAQPAKTASVQRPVETSTMMTDLTEPTETPASASSSASSSGKKNKSRR